MDMTQVILIGKLMTDPKTIKMETDQFYVDVTIKVYRPYKDSDGQFKADDFIVRMWKGAFLDLGYGGKPGCDVVIIGRLETQQITINGQNHIQTCIVGEKCSFNPLPMVK